MYSIFIWGCQENEKCAVDKMKYSVYFRYYILQKHSQNAKAYFQVQQNNVYWKGIGINYLLYIYYQNIYLIKNEIQNIHIIPQTAKIKLL